MGMVVKGKKKGRERKMIGKWKEDKGNDRDMEGKRKENRME
jgi:hypothetical protein